MSPQRRSRIVRFLRALVLLAVSVVAIGGGAATSVYFMKNRPKPQRRRPPQTAPLVEAQQVHAAAYPVNVQVNGTVIPAEEVTLQAQVTGRVVEVHPDFVEGGLVGEGDVLVRIEPKDYELAIVSQEAQIEAARYQLKAEQGQQDVAQREWELLGMQDDASALDKELALRQPQLRQTQAALRAAEAGLEKARLDLERTVIKAPCNAVILEAGVRVGDMATPQTPLAALVGTDVYWVQVSIAVDKLKWVVVPRAGGEPGSAVRIHSATGPVREGRVLSLLGDLEREGRMARLLVEVEDPLGLETDGAPAPLLLGEYVRAEILGPTVDNVVHVPREALRDGDQLWLAASDDTLEITQADIVWTNTHHALLRGLEEGARVILSDVATPVNGMAVQVRGDGPPDGRDVSGSPAEAGVKRRRGRS